MTGVSELIVRGFSKFESLSATGTVGRNSDRPLACGVFVAGGFDTVESASLDYARWGFSHYLGRESPNCWRRDNLRFGPTVSEIPDPASEN